MAAPSHFDQIWNYLFILLWAWMTVLAVSHLLYQKRSPAGMISWLLAIALMPFVAVPLYFLIGIRKIRTPWTKHPIILAALPDSTEEVTEPVNDVDRILRRDGIPPPSRGNRCRLLPSASESFRQIIREIDSAQESIEISTYLFRDDASTRELLEALTRRAGDGVRVRLLIDLVGGWPVALRPGLFAPLKRAGGRVLFFAPFFRRPLQSYVNLRNHRKIYLFDRRKVFSGGRNLAHEYFCDTGAHCWKDLLYAIEGPAVYSFCQIFLGDWNYASGSRETHASIPVVPSDGQELLQVVPSGPDLENDALYDALLAAIYSTRKRLWIVTPYFIPHEHVMEALRIACARGVDVALITPEHSDHRLVDLASTPYMRTFKEAGGRLLLYRGTMLHAKAMLFDDTAMIGSVNLDNRSLFLNYEAVTFAYSPESVGALESWMLELAHHCNGELPPSGRLRGALENLMQVLAPLL